MGFWGKYHNKRKHDQSQQPKAEITYTIKLTKTILPHDNNDRQHKYGIDIAFVPISLLYCKSTFKRRLIILPKSNEDYKQKTNQHRDSGSGRNSKIQRNRAFWSDNTDRRGGILVTKGNFFNGKVVGVHKG